MGTTLDAALRGAEVALAGEPAGRGATGESADVVLLAVPDDAIAAAAAAIATGPLVGHVSGATTLAPLHPHEGFSLHPLFTVTGVEVAGASALRPGAAGPFAGASAAISGTSERALGVAGQLARMLGMTTFTVEDEDRAAYHTAASVASNFLITLEGFAAELADTAGVPQEALVPLVRAAVDNWVSRGAAGALTGPVARGDGHTVSAQRAAVAARMPEQLALFDELISATRRLADRGRHDRCGGSAEEPEGGSR